MAKKHALYDNPAGYGHGGLGYDVSLDALPEGPPPRGQLPAWVPWVGLAGAGLVGAAGLRGLGKLFRRAPRAAKPIEWSAAHEMLGRESPVVQRTIDEAKRNIAESGYKLSSVLSGLGRIARGE
jgi:hypothetical protein